MDLFIAQQQQHPQRNTSLYQRPKDIVNKMHSLDRDDSVDKDRSTAGSAQMKTFRKTNGTLASGGNSIV